MSASTEHNAQPVYSDAMPDVAIMIDGQCFDVFKVDG